ncbi:MAG: ABC transporter permease [Desulfobacterales bacterium]|jgi:simple sugar transport system permease protein
MLHPTVIKRMEPLGWGSIFIVGGAVALSLVASALLLAAQGKAPVEGIWLLFQGGFGSRWALEDSLLKAIPIFLCSLGVGVAFRLQIWNIGAEGQFALGAVGASAVALSFPTLPAYLLIPLMMAASMAAGGLWGMIPGLLKVHLKANEIIITLMLNYIGILLLDYLVYGPWKDPVSFGFPMTPAFSANAVVGPIGLGRIHWGLLLCIGFGLAMWILLRFTRIGYELRASGENVLAARYAGLPYERLVVMVMVIGGALAGCAGFLEASANLNRLQPSIMVGYGYTAIIVAWLARLNPLQIAFAAYLLAGLRVGVENLQLDLQVPAAFGGIVEGLILLSVLAGGFFNHYRIRFGDRP